MLVLTRKYQEKIRIGDNITITVLRTKGKAVRLGIEAPANVPVIRGELSFEHEAEPATEPVATVAFNDAKATKQYSSSAGTATANRWETENRPDVMRRALASDVEPKVALSRVPRNQVAGMLPKLVAGNAPLRAMMDERCSK